MYRFVHQLNEIKKFFIQFKCIEIVLDLIIILLSGFLIFNYIGVKFMWILSLPLLIYLVITLKINFNKNVLKIIEGHYPFLKERLSTAYDNKEEKNVVIEDLARDISTDMDKVRYSSFISTNRLGIRVIIALLLVTIVLSSNVIINPRISEQITERFAPESNPDIMSRGSGADIFGEPAFVNIGNETQGLMVYRGAGSEQNVPGDRTQVPEYSRLFPDEEPTALSSKIYADNIPIVYQQIVKNYFANLSTLE